MWLTLSIYLRLGDAGLNFEQLTRQVLDKLGFTCGSSTPCVFVHEGVPGPEPGQGDVRKVVCLNRVFRWCLPADGRTEAVEIEADARHVESLTHQLNLQNAKSLVTPGVKSTSSDVGPTLPLEKHIPFRSICMRANYLAEDQDDVMFACKEAARLMSEPCEAGWEKLKRLGRYLAGLPRLAQRMERQDPPRCVLALSDSNHAACLRTRGRQRATS